MQFAPKDALESLEFHKIQRLLLQECLGEPAAERIAELLPGTDAAQIAEALRRVDEFKRSIDKADILPLGSYVSLDEDLRMLAIEGYVLGVEGLQRINQVLRLTAVLFRYFNAERQELYPALYRLLRPVIFDPALMAAIDQLVDDEGNIRPTASPELTRIFRVRQAKQRELDKIFRGLLNEYRDKGWLADTLESFRNGRRVLAVPAEHKRKIRGIIHDESSTGRTAFIEPEPVIELNNDLFDLDQQEKREIYRLLKELSATLRPYIPQMRQYAGLVVEFDFIRAKAQVARAMKAVMPRLAEGPRLHIVQGRHPLLWLKNQQEGRKTVPFDLQLRPGNHILLLSGPNAGGKSITMKSVGLLQVMCQCGLLIPADPMTEMGIFQQLFADIGDQQSLEDDLSTYSSRLRNMAELLGKADAHSLVLIDEFGSGTDPKIGGAIAEAILHQLRHRKSFGVITTHYSNLKIYAFQNKGIVNACMLFDREHLRPTYELRVGRPGSSYAFEIATKSGLGEDILEYARRRTGKNEQAVDQLLVDLQRDKQELEGKLAEVEAKQKQLDRLVKTYDQMHRDLEYTRKKLKLDLKEQLLEKKAEENRELEKLVRELREEKNIEKAKALAKSVKEERKEISQEIGQLADQVHEQAMKSRRERPVQVGSSVRYKASGATGEVLALDGKKALAVFGMMRMWVPLPDLEVLGEALEVKTRAAVQTDILSNTANFENRIDLRGMRRDEALQILEDFVDNALVSNAMNISVLHGKGDGVLKKAVRQKLREYRHIERIWHPEPEQGGDGITYASFG